MSTPRTLAFRIACVLTGLLLAGFVVLSVDVIVRVWQMRGRLGSGADAAVLLSYESARALTTSLALALGIAAGRRAATAGERALTLLLFFLAVWYTKSFAFEGFPGHLQERIAGWLFQHGVPPSAAAFVFGTPVWAAWLALGALLRVSVAIPEPLEAATIERSGDRDRAGLLRKVALAGLDIGAIARHTSARLLRRGVYRAAPVWLVTGTAAILHSLAGAAVLKAGLAAGFGLLLVLALTNLRAATMAAESSERRRPLWLLQAAVAAAGSFAASAILSVAPGRFTTGVSFGLAALAPPVVLMGLSFAIAFRDPPDPRRAIGNTLLIGLAAAAAAAAFVVSASLIRSLTRPALAEAAALLIAATSTFLLRSRIRRWAGRLGSGMLARS